MQKTLPPDFVLNSKYLIEKTLGQGGFGITYKAMSSLTGKPSCIKELFVENSSTRTEDYSVRTTDMKGVYSFQDLMDRFFLEADQLAAFNHPNIVKIHERFEANGTGYFVMDYVEGLTLKQLVKQDGRIPKDQAIPMIYQLLDALEVVHSQNILHRDIKPGNVLISPGGKATLIDFGAARDFLEGKSQAHTTIVTPGFAPPEQYQENHERHASGDIYSLAATAYYMLTAKRPPSAPERIFGELIPPNKIVPEIDSAFSSALVTALSLDPEDRFQNVSEFRAAMNQVAGKDEQQPRREGILAWIRDLFR